MDEPKNLNILTFVIGKYHHSVVNQIEDNLKDATEVCRRSMIFLINQRNIMKTLITMWMVSDLIVPLLKYSYETTVFIFVTSLNIDFDL